MDEIEEMQLHYDDLIHQDGNIKTINKSLYNIIRSCKEDIDKQKN